jgi:hypothetical protein
LPALRVSAAEERTWLSAERRARTPGQREAIAIVAKSCRARAVGAIEASPWASSRLSVAADADLSSITAAPDARDQRPA